MANNRPPLVEAMEWVTRIFTVAVEMALPALAGYWLDGRFGTSPWLTLLGTALGFVLGFYLLLKLVQADEKRKPPDGKH